MSKRRITKSEHIVEAKRLRQRCRALYEAGRSRTETEVDHINDLLYQAEEHEVEAGIRDRVRVKRTGQMRLPF